MLKTVIDDIIIYSDETGDIHQMVKMVTAEGLAKYVSDCERILNAKRNKKFVFPCVIMKELLIAFLNENKEPAAMVRFEIRHTGIIYSFGRLDENANVHTIGFAENGFFVYEKAGIIYF